MTIVKISVVAIIAVLLAVKLNQYNAAYGTYLSLAVCVFIILFSLDSLTVLVSMINKLSDYVMLDTVYIVILLKLIGISYICEFASGLCKDAGYTAVASQIEVAAKLSMLVISAPIIFALLDTVNKFLS